MKTKTESRAEFNAMLEKVLNKIKERSVAQYDYNINANVPSRIGDITMDNAAEHAVKSGIVSGTNSWLSFDCGETIRLAHHLLEDCNCHTEARALAKFIPEYA
jgi:hypothetical protein